MFFKSGRVNAAIVGQPYIDLRERCHDAPIWDYIAASYSLVASFAPNPQTSFHCPGHCFFAVLHERGQIVQWLPEQRLWAMKIIAAAVRLADGTIRSKRLPALHADIDPRAENIFP
jgi:hypothetical protein